MSTSIKTFVITGAGSGMGRATAIKLSKNPGNRLILIGRNEDRLKETKDLLENQIQHRSSSFDIRDASGWKNLFAEMGNSSSIDGVFANAGIGGENHYGENDKWAEIISVNLTGTYVTIMECLPALKRSNQAFRHIVITSSCLGRFGVPNYTAYCTAKTGLLGLTRSLAVELSSDQILVNAICPGWVETEMAKEGIQKLANHQGISYEESFLEQMSYVPLKRISQPEEIASLVEYLMSSGQCSMTGQGIDINNGSYML